MDDKMKFNEKKFMELNNYQEMLLHVLRTAEYLDDGSTLFLEEDVEALLNCYMYCLKNNKILNAFAIKKAINYTVRDTKDFELYRLYTLISAKYLPQALFDAFYFDFYATEKMMEDEEFMNKLEDLVNELDQTLNIA